MLFSLAPELIVTIAAMAANVRAHGAPFSYAWLHRIGGLQHAPGGRMEPWYFGWTLVDSIRHVSARAMYVFTRSAPGMHIFKGGTRGRAQPVSE